MDPMSLLYGVQAAGQILQLPKQIKRRKLQKAADKKNLYGVDRYVPDINQGGDPASSFIDTASRKVTYEKRTKI